MEVDDLSHAPVDLPPGRDPILIEMEAEWASLLVWVCTEGLVPSGIRSLDRPARSQSLHRLRYLVPTICA